jgi:hypothetical protein
MLDLIQWLINNDVQHLNIPWYMLDLIQWLINNDVQHLSIPDIC